MSQKKFSKSQAVAIFKRDILPGVIGHKETNGMIDTGAKKQRNGSNRFSKHGSEMRMADVEKVTEEIEVLSSEVIELLSKVYSDVQELKYLVSRRAHVDCRETCSITKDMAFAVSKINLIAHKRESIEGEGEQ